MIFNKSNGDNYKTTDLCEFDQTLGGIGGYCQGCNSSLSNPFQGTEVRNVYRCLQYVRSDFDLCNINDTARYAIENCGHHLEEVIKLYLKKNRIMKWVKVNRYPLGKLLEYISNNKMFRDEIVNKLKLFIDIYNISKHEKEQNTHMKLTGINMVERLISKSIKTDANKEGKLHKLLINLKCKHCTKSKDLA